MHISHIQIRDPFILKHAGYYYMYGSTDKNIWYGPGTGFDVYKSTDLENWSGPIPAFRPPKGFWEPITSGHPKSSSTTRILHVRLFHR